MHNPYGLELTVKRKTKKKLAYWLAVGIVIVLMVVVICIIIYAFHWWVTVILPAFILFVMLTNWIEDNL